LSLWSIDIFGSNIVGPTCSREGRAGEVGRRDAQAIPGAAATDGRGPPEADDGITVGPQSAVCLRASVLETPWYAEAPQVQLPPLPQVFFPPLARPAAISLVSYFEPCYFFLVVT
jgi:hypothetical protein